MRRADVQRQTGQLRTLQLQTGHPQTAQLKTGQLKTGQLKTGQLKTGQLKTGQLKTAQLQTGQLKTGRSRVPAGRRPWQAAGSVAAVVLGAGLLLAGCSGQTIKHGHQFHENDLQQVQPGMSVDQVKLVLGTPATTATVNKGHAYYYISSTENQVAFLKPTEVDRQVVAVYFSQAGTVERVANYGLKDGKVFDYVKRTTPAPGAQDEDLVKQLFRNLGKKQLFGD